MFDLFLILLSVILHLAVFFSLGLLTEKLLGMRSVSAARSLVFGYAVHFALFECLVLPMTFLHVPLSVFSLIWGILLCAAVLSAVLFCRGRISRRAPGVRGWQRIWILLLVLCVAWQITAAVLYQDTSADSAYYVGTASTSVYTNTLGRYNPYTGAALEVFPSRYIFSGYPMHNAFVSQVLGIPAIIQSKIVMTALNVLLANAAAWILGMRLFARKAEQAALFVWFVFLLNSVTGTLYTPGTFLFTRAYEGKALLANFAVLFVLYCCLRLYQEPKDNRPWILLSAGNLCAIAFSGSALFLPALVCSAALPALWKRKSPRQILWLAASLLPNILYTLAYLLTESGLLVLSAR